MFLLIKMNRRKVIGILLSLTIALSLMVSCSGKKSPEHYGLDDFRKVKKIDVHVHVNGTNPIFLDLAVEDNFRLATVNTDYKDFPDIDKQYEIALALKKKYPGRLEYFSTFRMDGWDDSQWAEKTIEHLDSTFRNDAMGVKFWKNIGMKFRDKSGNLVMVDDPGFDPIFKFIIKRGKAVIHHVGEPKNCWLPKEEMTVNNDKEYFTTHPQYYMYIHPEMPSYEDQISSRDRMLEKNPGLRYMGAHLASLEWNVDTLAAFLDRFPNTVVDMAARMGQLQAQSSENLNRVRNFLIKYQHRVLYATDLTQPPGEDIDWFREEAHNKWYLDWKYLATGDSLKVPELDHAFKGLNLPKEVLDNIYFNNAEKFYPGAWNK